MVRAMTRVAFLASAVRTPIAKHRGALMNAPADASAMDAIGAALQATASATLDFCWPISN